MGMSEPPDGLVFLDPDHAYSFAEFEGARVGITEWHRVPGGDWCVGFVPFKSYDPAHGWDVLAEEPLTLSPSLLCRLCGSHGFIRDGKWVPA